jgi:hypothetical protein
MNGEASVRPIAPQLVAVAVLKGVTVRTGRFRREQVCAFSYEDNRTVIGFPVYGPGRSFVVVDVLPADYRVVRVHG